VDPVTGDSHQEEHIMPTLGPWELGIILLIVIVIFGAGKLPEIGGALGRSIREFKANKDEAAADKEATAVKTEARPVVKDETVR
jgi:sec-independent protein translocase protein TatA